VKKLAYSTKNMLKRFERMVVDEDWQPTTNEIMRIFYPNENRRKPLDSMRRKHLTRLLIQRLRARLKKEGLYFYNVNGKYKVLTSYQERSEVAGKLWSLTNGFTQATSDIVDDTMDKYPGLRSNPFWFSVKGKLDAIGSLARLISGEIESQLKEAIESGEAPTDELPEYTKN
jgi:hypothetical protein